MKLLLDHCVPRRLARDFVGHTVETVAARGWDELRNGALLRAAADAGFQVFVTVDQNLRHQQNTDSLPLGVVVLCAPSNNVESLRALVPAAISAIAAIKPGDLIEVRAAE